MSKTFLAKTVALLSVFAVQYGRDLMLVATETSIKCSFRGAGKQKEPLGTLQFSTCEQKGRKGEHLRNVNK